MLTRVYLYTLPHVEGQQRYFASVDAAFSWYSSLTAAQGFLGVFECNWDKANHSQWNNLSSAIRLESPVPWSADMLEASYAVVQPISSGQTPTAIKAPEFFHIVNSTVRNDRVVSYDLTQDIWTTYAGKWQCNDTIVTRTNLPTTAIEYMPTQPVYAADHRPEINVTNMSTMGCAIAWGIRPSTSTARTVILRVMPSTDVTAEGLIPIELQSGMWVSSFFGTLENCHGVVYLPAYNAAWPTASANVTRFNGEDVSTSYVPVTAAQQYSDFTVPITAPTSVYDLEPYSYYTVNCAMGSFTMPARALIGETSLTVSIDVSGTPPSLKIRPTSRSVLEADAIGALITIEGIPVSVQNSQLNEFLNNGGIWKAVSGAALTAAVTGPSPIGVGAAAAQVGLSVLGAAVSPNVYSGGRVSGLLNSNYPMTYNKISFDEDARSIAEFEFSRNGYETYEMTRPLSTAPSHHYVVQTAGDCVVGTAPQYVLQTMNTAFKNGITFWSPSVEYMNYGS